jgi:predicted DNA-binding protein
MGKSRYVNLYLPEEIVKRVDDAASKEERSRNFIIKKILEAHLEKRK